MAKVPCPQCGNLNSSYIHWCLNCGAYCADGDFEPPSVSRAVEELFSTSSIKEKHENSSETPPETPVFRTGRKTDEETLFTSSQKVESPVLLEKKAETPPESPVFRPSRRSDLVFTTSMEEKFENRVKIPVPPSNYTKRVHSQAIFTSSPEENGEIPVLITKKSETQIRKTAVDELFNTSLEVKVKNWVEMPVLQPSVQIPRQSQVHFSSSVKEKFEIFDEKEAEMPVLKKISPFSDKNSVAPALILSSENPYYSNKKELEDYMRSSFADLDSCYQSISLRQSFKADECLHEEEKIVEKEEQIPPLPSHVRPDFVEEFDENNGEQLAIEAFDSLKLPDDIDFSYEEDRVSPISLPSRADYSEFFHLTPRIAFGDESLLLSLPSEMLLYVLSLLNQNDLPNVMLVCKKMRRFASDPSLWRSIVLRNRQLCDPWLINVGQRKPQALAFICCDGADLSSSSLAEMFRHLQASLISFTLKASSRGALDTDNVILRLAGQCGQKLTKLNISWSALTDVGLAITGSSFPNLSHLDLSGCQAITNETLCAVLSSIGRQLSTIILCQNSKLSEKTFESIAANCAGLQHLEINSFNTLTDIHIDTISNASTRFLKKLSLEHCKKMTEVGIVAISENCPALESLNLGNNRHLSRQCLHVIADQLRMLKTLNVSKMSDITDEELRILATNCLQLQSIDLSRLSKITPEGVLVFIASCPSLRAITLTGCSKIVDSDKEFFKQSSRHSIAIVI